MSSSSQLDREAIAYSHDVKGSVPSADEIVASLRKVQGDLGLLSTLLSEEERVVEDVFRLFVQLAQLLRWAQVEPSVLPAQFGTVERVQVSPEGELIYFLEDGEAGAIDLSDPENRDILVEVARDLAPKLRELHENPPVVEEPVTEELEPEPPVVEEIVEAEEPVEAEETVVHEEPTELEELAEPEELIKPAETLEPEEPAVEDFHVEEEPPEEEMVEPALEEEPMVEEPPGKPTSVEEFFGMEPLVEREEPEPRLPHEEGVLTDTQRLLAAFKRQRARTKREVEEYRSEREREIRILMEDLERQREYLIDGKPGLLDRLKGLFSRKRRKKE